MALRVLNQISSFKHIQNGTVRRASVSGAINRIRSLSPSERTPNENEITPHCTKYHRRSLSSTTHNEYYNEKRYPDANEKYYPIAVNLNLDAAATTVLQPNKLSTMGMVQQQTPTASRQLAIQRVAQNAKLMYDRKKMNALEENGTISYKLAFCNPKKETEDIDFLKQTHSRNYALNKSTLQPSNVYPFGSSIPINDFRSVISKTSKASIVYPEIDRKKNALLKQNRNYSTIRVGDVEYQTEAPSKLTETMTQNSETPKTNEDVKSITDLDLAQCNAIIEDFYKLNPDLRNVDVSALTPNEIAREDILKSLSLLQTYRDALENKKEECKKKDVPYVLPSENGRLAVPFPSYSEKVKHLKLRTFVNSCDKYALLKKPLRNFSSARSFSTRTQRSFDGSSKNKNAIGVGVKIPRNNFLYENFLSRKNLTSMNIMKSINYQQACNYSDYCKTPRPENVDPTCPEVNYQLECDKFNICCKDPKKYEPTKPCPCLEPHVPCVMPKLKRLRKRYNTNVDDRYEIPLECCKIRCLRADDCVELYNKKRLPYIKPSACPCIEPEPLAPCAPLPRLNRRFVYPDPIFCPIERCPPRADKDLNICKKSLRPLGSSKCPCVEPFIPSKMPNMRRLEKRYETNLPNYYDEPKCHPEKCPPRADDDKDLYVRKLLPVIKSDCICIDPPPLEEYTCLPRLKKRHCYPDPKRLIEPVICLPLADDVCCYEVRRKKLKPLLPPLRKKICMECPKLKVTWPPGKSSSICPAPEERCITPTKPKRCFSTLTSQIRSFSTQTKSKSKEKCGKSKSGCPEFKMCNCPPRARPNCLVTYEYRDCTKHTSPYKSFSECSDYEPVPPVTCCDNNGPPKYLQPRYPILPEMPLLKPAPPKHAPIDPRLEEECVLKKLCMDNKGHDKTCENFMEPVVPLRQKHVQSVIDKVNCDAKACCCPSVPPPPPQPAECSVCSRAPKCSKTQTCPDPCADECPKCDSGLKCSDPCDPCKKEKKKDKCKDPCKPKKEIDCPSSCFSCPDVCEKKPACPPSCPSPCPDPCLPACTSPCPPKCPPPAVTVRSKEIKKSKSKTETSKMKSKKEEFFAIWQKIVTYFKARPNCPAPDEWKKRALLEKADAAAKAAGLILCDPKTNKPVTLSKTEGGNVSGNEECCDPCDPCCIPCKPEDPCRNNEECRTSARVYCSPCSLADCPKDCACPPKCKKDFKFKECCVVEAPYKSFTEMHPPFPQVPVNECNLQEKDAYRKTIDYNVKPSNSRCYHTLRHCKTMLLFEKLE